MRPADATALLVLAHGAGAGMTHPFMEDFAAALADARVATLRFDFPYMMRGGWPPDRAPVLVDAVAEAVRVAVEAAGGLPIFAGGKSMGGRMTSTAAAQGRLPPVVRGIVFAGFPLHPAGKPGTKRAEHLDAARLPMLFLQGTRDRLADLDLLRPVVAALGERARLHIVDDADHGFQLLKRSGRTDAEVIVELARTTAEFIRAHTPEP